MPSLEAAGIDTVAVNPLQDNGLEQLPSTHVVKYVVVSDDIENKHLSDVISAWSMLPPDIQQAILLLVRQYVK